MTKTDNRATRAISRATARLAEWRQRHVGEKKFVTVLALVVGVFSGFSALILKQLIEWLSMMIEAQVTEPTANVIYLISPAVGVLLSLLFVRYVVKDDISHGVTKVLYAISQHQSRLKPHNMYSSVVASAATIGFGGSVGAEAPIVYTGAALGSNLGSAFRLSPRLLMILVGCGAAAGIAGIFKAPIAGLLFAIEVLMVDLTAFSVMPLLVASVSSATVAYIFTGYNFQFAFDASEPFVVELIPYVIGLGIFCGLVSLYFNYGISSIERFYDRIPRAWTRYAIGAITLGVLIFLLPPLYGEGYGTINALLDGDYAEVMGGSLFFGLNGNVWAVLLFIAATMLLKVFATSATNGAGGVGGTFAPSLYVGCLAGFLFAFALNHIGFVGDPLSVKNFALMGMAGVMAGVMHAPLMAIFLTAEMTGGYQLFLPLLVVAAISYGTVSLFSRYGIYTRRLANEGYLIDYQKDHAVLTLLRMDHVIERDFAKVTAEMTLKQMVDVIASSSRNLFPVVDTDGRLLGIVRLDDIRNIMFRPDLYQKMRVGGFMTMPAATVRVTDGMEEVMRVFDDTSAWNLPVVDDEGRYIGFVSKSKIFNSYRTVLKQYTD